MIGLLKKDFYLAKKSLFINIYIFLLIQFIVYIVRFSFIYGNPANQPPENLSYSLAMVDIVFSIITNLILFLPMINIVNVSLYSDFDSKWSMFMYTTPYLESQVVKIKYLECLGMWLGGSIIGMIINLIYHLIFNTEYSLFGLKIAFLICPLALIIEFLVLMASYKFKKSKTVMSIVAVIFAIVYLPLMYFLMNFMENPPQKYNDLSESETMNAIYNDVQGWILSHYRLILIIPIVLVILIGIISYKVCVSTLKRRDIVCEV